MVIGHLILAFNFETVRFHPTVAGSYKIENRANSLSYQVQSIGNYKVDASHCHAPSNGNNRAGNSPFNLTPIVNFNIESRDLVYDHSQQTVINSSCGSPKTASKILYTTKKTISKMQMHMNGLWNSFGAVHELRHQDIVRVQQELQDILRHISDQLLVHRLE